MNTSSYPSDLFERLANLALGISSSADIYDTIINEFARAFQDVNITINRVPGEFGIGYSASVYYNGTSVNKNVILRLLDYIRKHLPFVVYEAQDTLPINDMILEDIRAVNNILLDYSFPYVLWRSRVPRHYQDYPEIIIGKISPAH